MDESTNPINLRETIWARLRTECAAEIKACFLAIKGHQDVIDELTQRNLLPGQAEAMLKYLSENRLENPTPDRLEAHALILSKLKGIAQSPAVQFEAKRQANMKFLEVEPFIVAMESAVEASLDKQIAELVDAERAWFNNYGLPHEETAVSRMATTLKGMAGQHAYSAGKTQVEHAAMDYVPRINVASFGELFRGLN